jgi:thiamine pyrophosphate-dependent acetolactate synthase large subunit-like protein
LAGPGVVKDGVVAELRGLAVAGNLGVLNSWGAKGVFHWRSRHHLATVGLQEWDAELAGIGDADLLICMGVDSAETPPGLWRTIAAVDVPSAAIGPLSELWDRTRVALPMPALRQRLAKVTQSGWAVSGAPLAPSQVTRNYGQIVAAGGAVTADPGLAGFWVARTLGTTRPGAVHVTAESAADGFAVACAVAISELRPKISVLAAVDVLGPVAVELLEDHPGLAVEVWDDDGPPLDADEHLTRLSALLGEGGVVHLTTRSDQLPMIIEEAGPVTAWGGRISC